MPDTRKCVGRNVALFSKLSADCQGRYRPWLAKAGSVAKSRKQTWRRRVAMLAISALLWSSGQGAAVSMASEVAGLNTASVWHCLILSHGGGSKIDHHAGAGEHGHMAAEGPMGDGDHGFCPVCSLTGCTLASHVAVAEYQFIPVVSHHVGVPTLGADAPCVAVRYDPSRARAPPQSV